MVKSVYDAFIFGVQCTIVNLRNEPRMLTVKTKQKKPIMQITQNRKIIKISGISQFIALTHSPLVNDAAQRALCSPLFVLVEARHKITVAMIVTLALRIISPGMLRPLLGGNNALWVIWVQLKWQHCRSAV